MDPSGKFFDSGPGRAHAMISGWQDFGQPVGMELWVGEIAAAWHSGEPGVTNRFISSFWYADALGLLATLNHTGFCRQTLIGGNYGLLNRTTAEPNPDFYMAQMFHDVMGTRVLSLASSQHAQGFRTYAHCVDGDGDGDGATQQKRSGGAATLLLINVSPTVTFKARLPDGVHPPTTAAGVEDGGLPIWEFGAGDGFRADWAGLDSQHIELNGQTLAVHTPGSLPPLTPRLVGAAGGNTTLELRPLTITFVSVSGVAACA